MSKTIRSILEEVIEEYNGGFEVSDTRHIDQALSEIEDLMNEVIGEDKPVDMSFGRTEDQIIRDTCYTQGVNETKSELRQKLEQWKK